MLLGVFLHALVPYLTVKVPHLLWATYEPAGQPPIDAIFWWIHGFRVPLFFVISGVLAAAAFDRHGPREFVRRRLRRIGLPLALGTLTVLPLVYLVWAWGWVNAGLAKPRNILHVRFRHGMQQDLFGFAHLWFLEYLLLYCLLLVLFRLAFRRPLGIGLSRKSLIFPAILFGAPTLLLLWVDPRPIVEFHNWFWPRGQEFAYHGWFFAVGAWMGSKQGRVRAATSYWGIGLLASLPAFYWVWTALIELRSDETSVLGRFNYAAASACFAWSMIWGLLGPCCSGTLGWGPRGAISKLAAASYFLYVAHPPLVGAAQVLLYQQPVPAWLKAAIAFTWSVVICLAVYWMYRWRVERRLAGDELVQKA